MRARPFSAVVFCMFACATSAFAQQRDRPAVATTGSASIRGQIVSDGNPPRPIRRAIVTLTGDVPATRAAVTDDEGRFVFANLASGRYTIAAKKAAYLPATFGAATPGRTGTPLSLASDQQATVSIRMARGGVLAGRITDTNGRPAAGVTVTAQNLKAAPSAPPAGAGSTDDRGQYRLFGLMPGEYVVSARPSVRGSGTILSPSTGEMDAMLAEIARRSTAQNAAAAAPQPPLPVLARPIAFAPVYFPGTPLSQEAAPVKVSIGEERLGIDFALRPVGVATLEGVVSGPIANLGVVQISITPGGSTQSMSSMDANPVLEQRPSGSDGRFTFTSVVPGHYTIMARADRNQTASERVDSGTRSASDGGAISSTRSIADYLYAVADVDTRGDDVGGLALTLQGGGSFAGTVAFDLAPGGVPQDLSQVAVRLNQPSGTGSLQMGATIIGNTFRFQPFMTVDPQGRISSRNIAPGTYTLGAGPAPGAGTTGWWLRSAMAGGRDLLDEPITFLPGQSVTDVTQTFTDKHNDLSGLLTTSSGAPASEYFVLLFSTDRAYWRTGSRRVVTTRPGSDGKFMFRDVPAGTYFIAALEDLDAADAGDPKFLDLVIPAAIHVRVSDGEKTLQDLRIAR